MTITSSALYHRYLRLVTNWGVDATKGGGRDLGAFLRQRVAQEFSRGELTELKDLGRCQRQLESLERLAGNVYSRPTFAARAVSATGLNLEECRNLISTDTLDEFKNLREKGTFERLRHKLNEIRFTPEDKGQEPKKKSQ